jgi:hypothetical protein
MTCRRVEISPSQATGHRSQVRVMPFHFFRRNNYPSGPGERMVMEHARWLSWALRHRPHLPRIPVRKVSEGGFARLMATHRGREFAAEWWEDALDRVR